MSDVLRVLLADPDDHSIECIEPAIKHITELTVTKTSAEAIAALGGAGGPFDVVLVDAHIPDQGGLAILQQVAQSSPSTKRVLMSGARPENFPALVQSGVAHALVRKPALIDHLVATIIGSPAAATKAE
jgi:DNA-binding NarL/FixJ family response regulator